jgi:hypothetical protein
MEELSTKDFLRYSSLSRILQLLLMLYSPIFADSEAYTAPTLRYEEGLKTRSYWTRLARALTGCS